MSNNALILSGIYFNVIVSIRKQYFNFENTDGFINNIIDIENEISIAYIYKKINFQATGISFFKMFLCISNCDL